MIMFAQTQTQTDLSIYLFKHVPSTHTNYAGQLGGDAKSKSSSKSLSTLNAGRFVCVCVRVCEWLTVQRTCHMLKHIISVSYWLAEELTMGIYFPFICSEFFKQEIRIVFIRNVGYVSIYDIYHINRKWQTSVYSQRFPQLNPMKFPWADSLSIPNKILYMPYGATCCCCCYCRATSVRININNNNN